MTLSAPSSPPQFAKGLLDRLPQVRGRLTANAPLGHMTWFGVGGPAEVLFKPADRDDLAGFVFACPSDVPITVLGVASNMIIRDGGIPGVVIRLGREFADISSAPAENGGFTVTAGAAALDMNVALFASREEIAGLEFLSGIPGTIGGALRMNAGAYGRETKDALISADVLKRDGTITAMTPQNMGMGYRHNALASSVLFLSARLNGSKGDKNAIEARMDDIKTKRAQSQPIKTKTGGSTFANPEGRRAWQLVDEAGCRGLTMGGAQVSSMHCNFLINTGDATAADIERLGEEVRKRVALKSGVMLRWEIKRVGIPLEHDVDIRAFMRDAPDK